MESAIFSEMKEGCKMPCAKTFSDLIYNEFSIYLKYYKHHSLLKIVKIW